jgi:hypothetical protein
MQPGLRVFGVIFICVSTCLIVYQQVFPTQRNLLQVSYFSRQRVTPTNISILSNYIEIRTHFKASLLNQSISYKFFMYDDDVMEMRSMRECPGWSNYSASDVTLFSIMRRHPLRVWDPTQATIFVIPIPLETSFMYDHYTGNSVPSKCQGHVQRMRNALNSLLASPLYQKHRLRHYLHCHLWRCFVNWGWPDEKFVSSDLVQKGNVLDIIIGRFEMFQTSPSQCQKWRHIFPFCRSRVPNNQLSFYNEIWEINRCSIVVPYLASNALRYLKPSFESWNDRKTMLFSRTRGSAFAWGATNLRHTPVNKGLSHKIPNLNIGFETNRQEWVNGFENSKFCLIMRGDTPSSSALYNSIKVSCIPVIISDTLELVALPFQTQIPWSQMSLRFPEDIFIAEPMTMLRFLWQIPHHRVRHMLQVLQQIAQPRLLYDGYQIVNSILTEVASNCVSDTVFNSASNVTD